MNKNPKQHRQNLKANNLKSSDDTDVDDGRRLSALIIIQISAKYFHIHAVNVATKTRRGNLTSFFYRLQREISCLVVRDSGC